MAYTANCPQANQQISQSQPLIQANFMALAAFGNGYADFPVQSSAPSLSSGDTGLYTLANSETTKNEMYIVKPSVDAPTNIPFTASSMSDNTMALSVNGWSYLPSGLLMKWGEMQIVSDGLTDVDVSIISAGPDFNQVFTAFVSPILNTGTTPTFVVNLAATSFTPVSGDFSVICSGSTASHTYISYLVLGV